MSVFDDNFWRAVADYNLQFPNLAALGTNAADWLAEYARVKRSAFSSVLITASASEGASGSGVKNFPQATLVDALHYVRHQLDASYPLPVHIARAGRSGTAIRFSP